MIKRERCKEQVWDSGGWSKHQCSRYAVEDGYCKQHHPNAVAERKRKREEKAERDWQNSTIMRLERAREENEKLAAEIRQYREALELIAGDEVNITDLRRVARRAISATTSQDAE
jgi:hypothetical protein